MQWHSCLPRLHAAASGDSPAAKRMQPGVVGSAHLRVAMLGIVCLMLMSACLGASAQGAGMHYSMLGQQALQGTALRMQILCLGKYWRGNCMAAPAVNPAEPLSSCQVLLRASDRATSQSQPPWPCRTAALCQIAALLYLQPGVRRHDVEAAVPHHFT